MFGFFMYYLSVAGWLVVFFLSLVLLHKNFPLINFLDVSGMEVYLVILVAFLMGLAFFARQSILYAVGGVNPKKGRFIRRKGGLLKLYDDTVPADALLLQENGHCVIKNVFTKKEIENLKAEIVSVFDNLPADDRRCVVSEEIGAMYRYQMFNRSAQCQKVMAHKKILDTIEPLLGNDCHAITCTAWRNPPRQKNIPDGWGWHTDAGPHLPRPATIEWPEEMPYPIFVIGVHIYLEDCDMEDGPTGVIPGSHKSGASPPYEQRWCDDLSYKGRTGQAHIVKAGDVGMFVSDAWHRRIPPSENSRGRFFLQINYGRRDIAQRVLPCTEANHASKASLSRAKSKRERQLIGIHDEHFYDG